MIVLGGVRFEPPQNDPQDVRIVVCILYSHPECFVFCFESCVYSGGFCGSRIGGCTFWGCFCVGSRFGGHFERPELGLFLGARIGGSKIGGL